jgi:hypothetical protein
MITDYFSHSHCFLQMNHPPPQPPESAHRSTEASSLAGPSDMAGLISDPQTLLQQFAAGGNTTIHLTLHQNQHQHTTNNTTNNNIAGDSFVGNKTTANTQQSHNGGGTGSGSSGNNSSDRSGDNNTAGDRNTGGDCTDDNREALANNVAGSVADLIRPDLASLKAQMVEVQTAVLLLLLNDNGDAKNDAAISGTISS